MMSINDGHRSRNDGPNRALAHRVVLARGDDGNLAREDVGFRPAFVVHEHIQEVLTVEAGIETIDAVVPCSGVTQIGDCRLPSGARRLQALLAGRYMDRAGGGAKQAILSRRSARLYRLHCIASSSLPA